MLMLSGCGQVGPLYLPDDEDPPVMVPKAKKIPVETKQQETNKQPVISDKTPETTSTIKETPPDLTTEN